MSTSREKRNVPSSDSATTCSAPSSRIDSCCPSEHVLRRPQSDNHAPHRPEPRRPGVEAQEEEEQDDADLPDSLDLVDVLDPEQRMGRVRPERGAHHQQSQRGAEVQPASDAHRDRGHREDDGHRSHQLVDVQQNAALRGADSSSRGVAPPAHWPERAHRVSAFTMGRTHRTPSRASTSPASSMAWSVDSSSLRSHPGTSSVPRATTIAVPPTETERTSSGVPSRWTSTIPGRPIQWPCSATKSCSRMSRWWKR